MFLTTILAAIQRHLRARADARHLSNLSDRELRDIGISRYDIASGR